VFVWLLSWHSVVVQLLPELAVTGVHELTPAHALSLSRQVVVTQPLPNDADEAEHVWTGTSVVVTGGGQVVVT
jgi:hypothetical protein